MVWSSVTFAEMAGHKDIVMLRLGNRRERLALLLCCARAQMLGSEGFSFWRSGFYFLVSFSTPQIRL